MVQVPVVIAPMAWHQQEGLSVHLNGIDAEKVADAPQQPRQAGRPRCHPELHPRQAPPECCQEPKEHHRRARRDLRTHHGC